MVAYQQPGVAHYTGNVRLWQTANVVRAPKMDFDNEKRSIVAESDKSQTVSSLFVQQSQDGKLTPVDVTADKLTYVDDERRARYTGNVFARSATGTLERGADRRLPEARRASQRAAREVAALRAPTRPAVSTTWSPAARWW